MQSQVATRFRHHLLLSSYAIHCCCYVHERPTRTTLMSQHFLATTTHRQRYSFLASNSLHCPQHIQTEKLIHHLHPIRLYQTKTVVDLTNLALNLSHQDDQKATSHECTHSYRCFHRCQRQVCQLFLLRGLVTDQFITGRSLVIGLALL